MKDELSNMYIERLCVGSAVRVGHQNGCTRTSVTDACESTYYKQAGRFVCPSGHTRDISWPLPAGGVIHNVKCFCGTLGEARKSTPHSPGLSPPLSPPQNPSWRRPTCSAVPGEKDEHSLKPGCPFSGHYSGRAHPQPLVFCFQSVFDDLSLFLYPSARRGSVLN